MKDEKKKKKLGMLSMPEKRAGEEMDYAEMDEMEEGSDELDLGLEDAEEGDMDLSELEEAPMESEGSDLEAISDEELMAELKKRGLSSELGSEESEEEDDQGMYV